MFRPQIGRNKSGLPLQQLAPGRVSDEFFNGAGQNLRKKQSSRGSINLDGMPVVKLASSSGRSSEKNRPVNVDVRKAI